MWKTQPPSGGHSTINSHTADEVVKTGAHDGQRAVCHQGFLVQRGIPCHRLPVKAYRISCKEVGVAQAIDLSTEEKTTHTRKFQCRSRVSAELWQLA